MEIYIIRAANPLDMEGSAAVAAVFADKDLAAEAAEKLNEQQEVVSRNAFGDRWRSFAVTYEVETHRVQTDIERVLAYHKPE